MLLFGKKRKKHKCYLPEKFAKAMEEITEVCGKYDICPEEFLFLCERLKLMYVEAMVHSSKAMETVEELKDLIEDERNVRNKFPPIPKKDRGVG